MSKFNECVKQLKVKYSVHDAARTLKNALQSVAFFVVKLKKTTWPSSVTVCKEKCDKMLLGQ